MGRNNKQRRKQKKNRQKGRKHHKSNRSSEGFDINPHVSVVRIPIVSDEQGIRVPTDTQYAVQDQLGGLVSVKTIPQNLINKFRAVSSPFAFAGEIKDKRRDTESCQSWPQQWTYLSVEQVSELQEKDLINTKHLMMDMISLQLFGPYIYTNTHIHRFLDAYTEIAWIDYAIRQHLRNYDDIYFPEYITIGSDFEFNSNVAACWLTLENCIIRIAGMWDRLVNFLLPLYFFGKTYEEMKPDLKGSNKKFVLAKKISALSTLNENQRLYFDLLVKATKDYEDSDFKKLRDCVVHEFVYRPEGIVPTGSDTNQIPTTIEELHEQVLEQLSKVREAVIIFTAMMLLKSPTNSVTQIES